MQINVAQARQFADDMVGSNVGTLWYRQDNAGYGGLLSGTTDMRIDAVVGDPNGYKTVAGAIGHLAESSQQGIALGTPQGRVFAARTELDFPVPMEDNLRAFGEELEIWNPNGAAKAFVDNAGGIIPVKQPAEAQRASLLSRLFGRS